LPFDGIVTKCVVEELNNLLAGGRVEKIFQPEADEIIINIRSKGENHKLLLSASANYPRIHLTSASRENPAVPPVFCMLLRKHISGGRITGFEFHDFERIITMHVEAVNELGDPTVKKLIIEIMGRHSNIILVNEQDRIHDSIKHVDNEVSSVREVMPARPYILPPSQNKTSPEELDINGFVEGMRIQEALTVDKYLLNKIKGFSPLLCREICHLAGVDEKLQVSGISGKQTDDLKSTLENIIGKIRRNGFNPCIIYDDMSEKPLDYHCLDIRQYSAARNLPSMSRVIDIFYLEKDRNERLHQKRADIYKVLNNNLDRCKKKYSIQQEALREAADREKLRLSGELITANIYAMKKGAKSVSLCNYYSENSEYVDIPLDENLTPQENAQRYFKQYAKAKSTHAAASRLMEENLKEIEYLESVLHQLESASTVQDIDEVRQELAEQGYMSDRRKPGIRKQAKASQPLHYISSDGLDIYVGKNNKQNDLLTLKQASSNDIWLHTKDIPGSHVIVRKRHDAIPDKTLYEASMLAAYHSKAKMSSGVPVDYTQVKNVRKPQGAKPGMVIYDSFKTIIVTPDENLVNSLKPDKTKRV